MSGEIDVLQYNAGNDILVRVYNAVDNNAPQAVYVVSGGFDSFGEQLCANQNVSGVVWNGLSGCGSQVTHNGKKLHSKHQKVPVAQVLNGGNYQACSQEGYYGENEVHELEDRVRSDFDTAKSDVEFELSSGERQQCNKTGMLIGVGIAGGLLLWYLYSRKKGGKKRSY